MRIVNVTSTTEAANRPGNLVSAQMGLGATVTDRIYMQHFGLVSRPNAGDHVLLDDRDRLAIAGGSEDRPSIEDGEVCLYSSKDISIILKPGDEIIIKNSTQTIKVSGNNIELGNGILRKLMTDTFVGLFNSHTHYYPTGQAVTATTPPIVPLLEATVCTNVVSGA